VAYAPAVLLKIVLSGDSKGMVSSRRREEACRRTVVCMAWSADTQPHCTTLEDLVAPMAPESITLLCDVL
jgi:hypothetical protein